MITLQFHHAVNRILYFTFYLSNMHFFFQIFNLYIWYCNCNSIVRLPTHSDNFSESYRNSGNCTFLLKFFCLSPHVIKRFKHFLFHPKLILLCSFCFLLIFDGFYFNYIDVNLFKIFHYCLIYYVNILLVHITFIIVHQLTSCSYKYFMYVKYKSTYKSNLFY